MVGGLALHPWDATVCRVSLRFARRAGRRAALVSEAPHEDWVIEASGDEIAMSSGRFRSPHSMTHTARATVLTTLGARRVSRPVLISEAW